MIETVINKGVIGTFNKLAEIFPGMSKVDEVSLPSFLQSGGAGPAAGRGAVGGNVAMATGGVLPGYTPGKDVHRFVSPTGGVFDLSGGEGILRPELVRAIGVDRWNAANAAARRGDVRGGLGYLGGFADGGVLGWLGSAAQDATDVVTGVVRNVVDIVRNPVESLRSVVRSIVGDGAGTGFGSLLTAVPFKLIEGIGGFLGGFLGGANADPNAPALPGNALGYQAMIGLLGSVFPGARVTSSYRPGAITAVGTRSYHSLGRAIDIAPDMAIFNYLAATYPNSRELFYSPAGPGRQILNRRAGARLAPVTVADHYDHIHWAMANGGIVPNLYDNGGALPPGLSLIANQSGKPEQVLTNSQWNEIRNSNNGGTTYEFDIEHMGADAAEVALEIEQQRARRVRLASSGMGVFG